MLPHFPTLRPHVILPKVVEFDVVVWRGLKAYVRLAWAHRAPRTLIINKDPLPWVLGQFYRLGIIIQVHRYY